VAPGDNRRHDRVQPVALAQQVLLEQKQPGKGSTNVAKPNDCQADVTDRPPGLFYACLTW
jgi:hypothetical protein